MKISIKIFDESQSSNRETRVEVVLGIIRKELFDGLQKPEINAAYFRESATLLRKLLEENQSLDNGEIEFN